MNRLTRVIAAALVAVAAGAPLAAAETEVDLELALAVDVSRSMDLEELRIQRAGYVAAFRDEAVHRAIEGGLLGRVAISYFEWGGRGVLRPIVEWTLVDDAAAAERFAEALEAAPVRSAFGTSISGAIDHAVASMDDNGFAGLRRVVDISGDGPNNTGGPVVEARDAAIAAGVTINGLPLMMKAGGGPFSIAELDIYYEDCVVGGPLSFVLPLWNAEAFAETIRRKMVLEIGAAPPAPEEWPHDVRPRTIPAQLGLGPAKTEPRIDCLIGERLRRQWELP